jgi:glucokinase
MEKFLGIDFGGTNIKFGQVTRRGGLTGKKKFPTQELGSDPITGFLKLIKEDLDKNTSIQKIGIGIPGSLSRDRRIIIETPNVPQLKGVPLMDILKKSMPSKQFYLENDANTAALGELYFSSDELPDSFIFITLGTGVGGAVIIDRQIFVGGGGNAMEIGHIVSSNGLSVEQRIGKKGLVKLAFAEISNYIGETQLTAKFPLTSKRLELLAQSGDSLAQQVFRKAGMVLGEALVSAIRLFDIKTVVIGGGVADNFEFMKEGINASLQAYLTPYYLENLMVLKASLQNDAGIIGAACLCFRE